MKIPKFKDYTNQPVKYIQAKMDGHMYYVTVNQRGVITCLTKNGKDKTDKLMAIDHISEELYALPPSTELMAELHCPGEFATSVPTMLNNADERLQLSVFACPTLCGIDLSDMDLVGVEKEVTVCGLSFVPVELVSDDLRPAHAKYLLKEAIELKIEGWVLKESHMEGWYKLKPVKTIDAFVIDVTESDSAAYAGHMKAVRLRLFTGDLDDDGELIMHDLGECGGGFTKKFKLSMTHTEAYSKLVGRVCEVAYQSVTPGKKLQFPRFVRFRDDKDASQCTVEQLNE